MLLAFIVLGIIVTSLIYLANKKEQAGGWHDKGKKSIVPLISTSAILGIGIGGFIDGILLHQILQWHEMLSNKLPPIDLVAKSVNMFWDGVFHAFTLIVTTIGIFFLFSLLSRRDVIISKRLFIGGMVLGWGLFNIVEGVIDHHILKLHNVREISDNVDAWNYGFLVVSVFMIVGAVWAIFSDSKLSNS
ncbi:MAG TPA: DUF2243 domain-containing protein [Pedobacter sp.]|jgi:uncharacterized membrane protein